MKYRYRKLFRRLEKDEKSKDNLSTSKAKITKSQRERRMESYKRIIKKAKKKNNGEEAKSPNISYDTSMDYIDSNPHNIESIELSIDQDRPKSEIYTEELKEPTKEVSAF
mmetsp:Transcript_25422/g.28232  ORF Transcript_25422/g.28232 Transcript_25422/m.28232 type:complete len:110 (-) Transcript_25422:139-468(-)